MGNQREARRVGPEPVVRPVASERAPEPVVSGFASMGNAAFARLVQADARRPRTPALSLARTVLARSGERDPAIAKSGDDLFARVNAVSAGAGAVHAELLSGMRVSRQTVDNIAAAFDQAGEQYHEAYVRFRDYCTAVGASMKQDDEYIGIVLGIIIGTSVGLAMAPVGAAAEKVGRAAVIAAEVLGEIIEAGIAGAHGKVAEALPSNAEAIEAKLAEPNVTRPEMKKVEAWQMLAQHYKTVAAASDKTAGIPPLMQACTAVAFATGKLSTGAEQPPETTVEKIGKQVRALEKGLKAQAAARDDVRTLQATLELAYRAAVEAVEQANPSQIERELWIEFVSGLSFSEAVVILDDNDIEDRLNALGVQGPDSPIGFSPIGDTDPEDTWEVPLKARIYQLRREIVGKRGTTYGSQVTVAGQSFEASVAGDPPDGTVVEVVDVTRQARGGVNYGEDAGILVVCTPGLAEPAAAAAPEPVPVGVER
jgi:hypothetical protein